MVCKAQIQSLKGSGMFLVVSHDSIKECVRLLVRLLVGPSVGWSVGQSVMLLSRRAVTNYFVYINLFG